MPDDDDYDDVPQDECDHDAYEIDILTGRAECSFCPHSWYLTSEEIEREIERQASYHEDCEREERRQWWRDLLWPIRRLIHRTIERFRIWRAGLTFREAEDDEIPF